MWLTIIFRGLNIFNSTLVIHKIAIDHSGQMSGQYSKMLFSEEFSDLTLIVEGNRFPAHRVILAARSDYFR
jgi:hypothetical protein